MKGVRTFEPGLVDPAVVVAAEPIQRPRSGNAVPGEVSVPVEPMAEELPVSLPRRRRSPWGRAFWLLVVLLAAFLAWDTGNRLVSLWHDEPVAGALFTALTLAFVLAAGAAVSIELRAFARLRHAERFRAEVAAAEAQDSHRRLRAAIAPVLAGIGTHRPELARDFAERTEGQTDCEAITAQFRGAVLTPLDREARRVVRANALAVLGATAVSPHPVLDVAIVAWRSVAMVRRIAELYGLRPSTLATASLSRMVLASAAFSAVADPANEALVDALGGGFAEKLSGRVAEGSILGLRTARLGVRAIEAIRPLPFEDDERQGLLATLMRE
jgi:putative membrane protein